MNILTPFSRFYTKALKPAWNAILSPFKKTATRLSNFLGDKKKRTLNVLEGIQGKIKATSFQQFVDKILPNSFLSKLPAFLKSILLTLKNGVAGRFLLKGTFFAYKWIVLGTTGLIKGSVQAVAKIGSLIVEGTSSIRKSIIAFGTTLKNSIASLLGLLSSGIGKGTYGTLLFVTMTGIVLGWGLELLGEITHKTISKVPSFTRKEKA